ncbi:hypothetical protein SBC1_61970 (plasmid) [Caballeronia sp. SBC1]|uniref:GGDEF domain-containing protein n=1 Tax=unclassified Caballeronia TaxID=2646786 RepID=UPI0013E13F6E|nr:hypothetical protein SBC2_61620 [Caballeronia sp. SBC2]QIN66150.1 hypothetical protein SBC1_61970 [Caballeronia sp. SBC1]
MQIHPSQYVGVRRLGDCRKIRAAICACQIEHAGSEYGCVTASIGAASGNPQAAHDVTTVINAADEALYEAKATGRNKVWTARA